MSIVIVILSILIEQLTYRLKISKILSLLGQNTLVILLMNSSVIEAWELVRDKFILINNENLLNVVNFGVSVLLTLICALIGVIVRKYCPYLIGKTKI